MPDFREKLSKVKCFLLDMDGTVYLGNKLIGDMKNTLSSIRNSGRRIVFLTNNSSKSAETYREKLRKLDIYDEADDIFTSGMATVEYLSENHPNKSVYLVGTDAIKEEWKKAGVPLTEGKADIAVLAYEDDPYDLTDFSGNRVAWDKGYKCKLTIVNGEVVYRG